jgi:methionyl-tRNA formyltransferase
MRVLFAGSPAIAVPVFETLCVLSSRNADGVTKIEIAGVLTNPDTPKGRHASPLPTEVGASAETFLRQLSEQGRAFPLLKPLKLDAPIREQVAALKPDLLVSFAYGKIFGPKFLALFPLGGINFHPSLLPKYRGPSPIQAAILNRDFETGITVQKLALEMDSGNIIAQERFQLTLRETTGSLSEIMAQKAAALLGEALDKIAAGNGEGTAQNHSEASYCKLICREDALIDWKRSAAEIEAMVRAFNPWPLCRTIHKGRELFILKADVQKDAVQSGGGGVPCKVPVGKVQPGLVLDIDKKDGILVQTGEGILSVTELQYQGKKALFWRDFLNGARDFSGAQLG